MSTDHWAHRRNLTALQSLGVKLPPARAHRSADKAEVEHALATVRAHISAHLPGHPGRDVAPGGPQ